MEEQWRDIRGLEGYYQISDQGRVKRLAKTERLGKPVVEHIVEKTIMQNGYNKVGLCYITKGKRIRREVYIHTLVAEAFLGMRHAGYYICHINGDKLDNRACNLQYKKYSEANEKLDTLRRPAFRSLIHSNEWFQFDRMFLRSIEYNKVLFYALPDYYDAVGWIYLIKYYISYSYTLEKRLGLYGIEEHTLDSMREYAEDTVFPWIHYELEDKDKAWFELAVDVMLFYFKEARSTHKNGIVKLLSKGGHSDV